MSLITKNNYEAYLLDYVEENLSPELIAELMLFFENNPELKEDLEEFEIHELIAPEVELADKSQLRKVTGLITISNYEDFIIAEVEGLNTNEISDQLEIFLGSNPNLQKEFLAYENTKLVGAKIIFDNKKALLQKETKIVPMYWWSSVAAAAILILVWFNGLNNNSVREYSPLAETNDVVSIDNENEDLLNFYVFDDAKHQMAVRDNKKVNPNLDLGNEKNIKGTDENKENDSNADFAPEVLEEDVNLITDNSVNETVKDDVSALNDVQPEIEKEEVLYAENSVKITYEDEVLNNGTPNPERKKMTKLEIIRKAIKQQVKTKVLDKGKDKMLLAVNSNPINFIRGRKKK